MSICGGSAGVGGGGASCRNELGTCNSNVLHVVNSRMHPSPVPMRSIIASPLSNSRYFTASLNVKTLTVAATRA